MAPESAVSFSSTVVAASSNTPVSILLNGSLVATLTAVARRKSLALARISTQEGRGSCSSVSPRFSRSPGNATPTTAVRSPSLTSLPPVTVMSVKTSLSSSIPVSMANGTQIVSSFPSMVTVLYWLLV